MAESEDLGAAGAESRAEAWQRRAAARGEVDFTMMYVAHDAFARDLSRLTRAATDGRAHTPAARATWETFTHHLHTHHTAEDEVLWPALRRAAKEPTELAVLDAMEAEHASLDPGLDRIEAALANKNTAVLLEELTALSTGLLTHMRHEEAEALPLLERRLGAAGWEAFTEEVRRANGGIRGASEYIPWILDGTTRRYETPSRRSSPRPPGSCAATSVINYICAPRA